METLTTPTAPTTPTSPTTPTAQTTQPTRTGTAARSAPADGSTLGEAISRHGIDVDAHLDREVLVPVLAGLQAQGDVLVVPRDRKPAGEPVPPDGIAVVRGEFGGNTHTLLAEGDVRFDRAPQDGESLDLGLLTVADGAVAYLAHPEHAYSGIAPGTYLLRRQREVAATRVLPQPVKPAAAPRVAPVPRAVRYVED